MAYNARAVERRRCTAIKPNGEPCQGWAMWDPPTGAGQVCGVHAGRHHRGMQRVWNAHVGRFTARPERPPDVQPCHCAAYAWPHRPGGGLCRWPLPPEWVCTIPSGTRHFISRSRRR